MKNGSKTPIGTMRRTKSRATSRMRAPRISTSLTRRHRSFRPWTMRMTTSLRKKASLRRPWTRLSPTACSNTRYCVSSRNSQPCTRTSPRTSILMSSKWCNWRFIRPTSSQRHRYVHSLHYRPRIQNTILDPELEYSITVQGSDLVVCTANRSTGPTSYRKCAGDSTAVVRSLSLVRLTSTHPVHLSPRTPRACGAT
jgi:hypothetical protein